MQEVIAAVGRDSTLVNLLHIIRGSTSPRTQVYAFKHIQTTNVPKSPAFLSTEALIGRKNLWLLCMKYS